MTALYSILHLLVDGVCAYAMYGNYLQQEQGYIYVLLYNFCAFALQMPFGAALDILNRERGKLLPLAVACVGVILTLTGALTHPVVLGIGNALFHIGGGVGTIYEDGEKGWLGRGLGVFVAPGALGLHLGMQLSRGGVGSAWLWTVGALMLLICAGMTWRYRTYARQARNQGEGVCSGTVRELDGAQSKAVCLLAAGVLLVVILRSYIGMAVTFPWKTTALAAFISTLAIVCGKAAGGFMAARFGISRTVLLSLTAAAVSFLFSRFMPMGILALFLFNMTMPVTLYLLIRRLPLFPGFSFGFLTFGLFLGFLPTYLQLPTWSNRSMIGCVGSLLSLLILLLICVSGGDMRNSKQHITG
ncbi:MAG: hypothetical protein NC543_02375 [bacterium]|nr:hypothetical protein [bacterium]MCM1374208.1 hypothetical protein [Muribaculum sp.]